MPFPRFKAAGVRGEFSLWRIVVWALLLLAAFGGIEYISLLQKVSAALSQVPASDSQSAGQLQVMMAWAAAYLVVAFAIIVACVGCILRQGWARPILRTLSLLLAAWFAWRAIEMWQQWSTFSALQTALFGGDQPTAEQSGQLDRMHRLMMLGLGMRVVAVPLLLWLVWQLGQPAVLLQFKSRRG